MSADTFEQIFGEKPGKLAKSVEKPWLWKPGQSGNPLGRAKGWRSALKAIVGENGEKLWALLLAHAEGRPIIPTLPDGRQGAPIVPTADTTLRATIELAHMLAGRPVNQAEIMQAEKASADMAEIQALSDQELEQRARAVLERGLRALDARKPGAQLAELAGELVKPADKVP